MTEENKGPIPAPEQPTKAPESEEPKAAEPAQPQLEAAPQAVQAPKEEKKPAPAKIERPANCASCNKPIKKKWYYRNGKYFCTKRCWTTSSKKEKNKADAETGTPAK